MFSLRLCHLIAAREDLDGFQTPDLQIFFFFLQFHNIQTFE